MTPPEQSAGGSGKLTPKVVGGVAAASAGLIVTGVAGPIAGALAAAALQPVFEQVAAYDRRAAENAAMTAARAAEIANTTPEGLAEWAQGSPRRLTLLAMAVEAAWRYADEQKVEALARVLADGMTDDARLDVDPLFIAAIRELEPAHVRTLNAMLNDLNVRDEFPDKEIGESGEWATEHLIEHLPTLADGMDYIVATLDRVGCIALGGSRLGAASWWRVTPFGRACMEFLAGAAGSAAES